MLKNPKTEAKSETKRLFSMSGQREALPDSGSHHLFSTLLEAGHRVQLLSCGRIQSAMSTGAYV